ncbi:MAG: DUF951 domain-containing protein [Anaerolineaceae bacterium]|nr:DUF951 domain-containing protein [Anaerolineaceae bacterium]
MTVPIPPLTIGCQVQLRKAHPCGSAVWVVTRLGADIGLRCVGCGRQVLLSRNVLAKRLKRVLSVEKTIQKDSE